MSERRCIVLLCAYDGGAFSGFQRHPPNPTIQGALEGALQRLGLAGRIEGAGRTDRGVHACGQVVAFRSREAIDPGDLQRRLMGELPDELVILAAREAPDSFHPRFSAIRKTYRYRIFTGAQPPPWAERFTWTLPDLRGFPTVVEPVVSLDVEAMKECLTACVGRHDFSLLIHPRAQGKKVRWLDRATLQVTPLAGGTLYDMAFVAEGFLRHQIRNLVGMVASAGLGLLPREERVRLLSAEGDRWRGARAPGRGLTLERVGYRAGEDPFLDHDPGLNAHTNGSNGAPR